jgi:hypothetical protein
VASDAKSAESIHAELSQWVTSVEKRRHHAGPPDESRQRFAAITETSPFADHLSLVPSSPRRWRLARVPHSECPGGESSKWDDRATSAAIAQELSEQLNGAQESAETVLKEVKKAREITESAKKALRVIDTADRRKKPRPPTDTQSKKRRRSKRRKRHS